MSKIKTALNARKNTDDIDRSVFVKTEQERQLSKKLKAEWKAANKRNNR